MFKMLKIFNLCNISVRGRNSAFQLVNQKNIFVRNYAVRKRFYKNTNILHSNGKYEITLDQRKLKTAKGNLFTVENEPLAIAVATEWDMQRDKINQSSMHLTTLCNTVLDNPNNLSKFDMVQYLVNYLDTDTILFQAEDPESDMYKLQQQEWDPVIEWFNKRFEVDVQKSCNIVGPTISEKDKATIMRHLLSYNFAAVHGYVYGVDTLKSIILALACMERVLTPEKAVLLSRLEEEFQAGRWGRVEWAHDLSQQDLEARLSATVLFIYFNSSSSFVRKKEGKGQQTSQ